VAGSCEQGNELLGSTKHGKFPNKQSLTSQEGFCSIQFVRRKSNSGNQNETGIKDLLI